MPRFLKIKRLVEGGAIGEPRAVTVRLLRPDKADRGGELPWRVRPEVSGGGLFVDLGSHTLDFLDFLLGPITEVVGMSANQVGSYHAEDIVAGSFSFASGVHGTGLWCFSAHEPCDEVELIGSSGSLRFSSFDETPLRLMSAEGETLIDVPYPSTVQAPLIQTVVDALIGRGACPSTGESALRTARVIDKLLHRG